MKGIRIEIMTPVQDTPTGPLLGYRRTSYFFTGNNITPSTKEVGTHWFFDNDLGFHEAYHILEAFWDYCVRHNRIHMFDREVHIRYEYVPLKNTVYTDKIQFVQK